MAGDDAGPVRYPPGDAATEPPDQPAPAVVDVATQRAGAPLGSRGPDPEVRLARLFDAVDDSGPQFAPDHPVIASDEAHRLVEYLLAGEPLLLSWVFMDDILDQTRPAAVPMNFRTDGTWVWNDACAYYVERYGLAPDPGLLAHIRRQRYVLREVDGAARHRALAVLGEPVPEESVWTFFG